MLRLKPNKKRVGIRDLRDPRGGTLLRPERVVLVIATASMILNALMTTIKDVRLT